MDYGIFDLLKFSTIVWIIIYGVFGIISELFSSTLPLSLCLIAIFPLVITFVRVKPPCRSAVEAVLGRDPLTVMDGDDPNEYVMRTIAHRGCSLDAPENSLIAFHTAAQKGCLAVEFDVALTKDDVPIIFHDDTCERLCDVPHNIRQTNWDELKTLDIAAKHPLREKFKDTRIALFEDTVVQCMNDNQRMIIDIKETDTKIVNAILDIYKRFPQLYMSAACSSFYPNVLYKIRSRDPKIVCTMAYRPYIFAYDCYSAIAGKGKPWSNNFIVQLYYRTVDKLFYWAVPTVVYYILGLSGVLLLKDCVSSLDVYNWRSKGVRVLVWTVNHPVEKTHLARNVKIAYFTDTLVGEATIHGVRKSVITPR